METEPVKHSMVHVCNEGEGKTLPYENKAICFSTHTHILYNIAFICSTFNKFDSLISLFCHWNLLERGYAFFAIHLSHQRTYIITYSEIVISLHDFTVLGTDHSA